MFSGNTMSRMHSDSTVVSAIWTPFQAPFFDGCVEKRVLPLPPSLTVSVSTLTRPLGNMFAPLRA